jgi:acetyl esterase/lipase
VKRFIRLTLAMLLVVTIFGVAVMGVAQNQPLNFPVGMNVPTEYDPLPDRQVELADATMLADVTYSTVPGFRPLRLDLYQPKGKATPHPLVVFAHGGGWTIGQKRGTADFLNFPDVLAGLAKRGYVVASLEYRLSSEAPFPAAVQDVKAAIRFLRANAERYAINPDRVAVWGSSAGSHLTGMAAYACGVAALEPEDKTNSNVSDCVQGFVGWYGPYDLKALLSATLSNNTGSSKTNSDKAESAKTSGSSPTDNSEMMGGLAFFQCTAKGCPPGMLEKASPIAYVDKKDPPTLLIHGTSDRLVPSTQSQMLAEKLRAVGVPVEVLMIPGVDHGFRGTTQSMTRDASLKALSATFVFLDKLFAT